MFGRWLRGEGATEQLSGGDALHTSIARELPGADTETVTVVTSMAGLLGAVAYADRNYSANEARDPRPPALASPDHSKPAAL